jgi:signal transduction histidine kinase
MDVRSNRFLDLFTPGGQARLIENLIPQDVEPGDYLFREGDRAEGVCLLLEGQVESFKSAPGGHEQPLNVFNAGDYLGEVAVLDGGGRSASARARSRVSVAWIPTTDLFDVLLKEPVGVTLNLFQNVLALLRRTNTLYVEEIVHKEKMMLIGEMAGSLMHDLRNPVQVILSSLELIKINHDDAETKDCCRKMEMQCDRLVSMAAELLEFSRGETKLNLVRTDTESFMKQVLSTLAETFVAQDTVIDAETDPAEIEIDVERLLRAVNNLIANAVQAVNTRAGGKIDLHTWVADSALNVSVRDNGAGISPEVKARLFEPFVTFGKPGGTGLGLAIVKNVALAHRGKVTVESQPGQGTEFLIRLPQDAASAAIR